MVTNNLSTDSSGILPRSQETENTYHPADTALIQTESTIQFNATMQSKTVASNDNDTRR